MASTLPDDVARTRKLLLDAACDQFIRDGYDGARLKDIADAAGLSTGAVYSQFRNKRELMLAAIFDNEDTELQGIVANSADDGSIVDRMEDGTRRTITQDESRTRARILLLEAFVASRRDPLFQERLRDYISERRDLMVRIIGMAKSAGEITPDVDADGFTDLTFALGLGLVFFDMGVMDMPQQSGWDDAVGRLFRGVRTD